MPMAEKLLEIPAAILHEALHQELQDDTVVADTIGERRCIFLGYLWHAEKVVAERLNALAGGQPSWPRIDTGKAIPWVERQLGVTLAESQREAVTMAVSSKTIVITGGPGVGKTTLVDAILRILVAKGVSRRVPGWRPRPSTVSWRWTPGTEDSNATATIHSTVTSWWSMRHRWWTSR